MPSRSYNHGKYRAAAVRKRHRLDGVSVGSSLLNSASDISVDGLVTTGPNLPSWRARIHNRQSATTSLDADVLNLYTISDSSPTVFVTREWSVALNRWRYHEWSLEGGYFVTSQFNESFTNLPSLTAVTALALTRWVQKARRAQQSLQGLVALGEIGETIRMIKRPLHALFKKQYAYLDGVERNVRRHRRRTLKDKNRVIAETWLEYSFGWSPLINDIKGAAEGLARLSTFHPPAKRVRANAEERNNGTLSTSFYETDASGCLKIAARSRNYHKASARFSGCVSTQPPTFAGTLGTFGISVRELVPTLWELIPYSFLVDYFTNAGNIIEGATFNRADVRWIELGTSKETKKVFWTSINRSEPPPGHEFVSLSAPELRVEYERRVVHREEYLGGFIPPLMFTIPGLSTKWLNIGALLASSRSTSKRISRL